MNRADAEEYTEALGQVVAGGYRLVAHAQRLGVPKALGLSTPEWVEQRLGGYVRMSIPDRRDAVAELGEEGMSTREIGNVLGVDHATAARDAVANATAKSRASAKIESAPVANATRYPDAEDSEGGQAVGSEGAQPIDSDGGQATDGEGGQATDGEGGQAMLEHPALARERMRESFCAAAEATAKLLEEFDAVIDSLDGEHRDSAQSTAVQAIDTWRRILHHLERPKVRRAW
jgi:hypothetical protein